MKRHIAYILTIAALGLIYIAVVYANCPPSWVIHERIIRAHPEGTPFEKTTLNLFRSLRLFH
jgi:hypothetical protein